MCDGEWRRDPLCDYWWVKLHNLIGASVTLEVIRDLSGTPKSSSRRDSPTLGGRSDQRISDIGCSNKTEDARALQGTDFGDFCFIKWRDKSD